MRLLGVMAGLASATMVAAAVLCAAPAQAQSAPRSQALTNAEGQRAPAAQTRPGLQLDRNGRWGLNLDVQQPVGRETEWSDVEARAYYRINPRVSVGASAGLSTPRSDPARPAESDRRSQPRVRLETIFRF